MVFVFDVETCDVWMKRNLLCDVRDTALLCSHVTCECFTEKRSARLVDVLDLREKENPYRREKRYHCEVKTKNSEEPIFNG